MDKNLSRIGGGLVLLGGVLSVWGSLAGPPPSTCPRDLEPLIERLLQDLPAYANRVLQRSRSVVDGKLYIPLYVLIAGRPEFEPLPLRVSPGEVPTDSPDTTRQVFFTTLENLYDREGRVSLQGYHWLFLTPTSEGWRLVTLYSQLAAIPPSPPLPPEETGNGPIAQAIRLWLRDCEAGALR